MKDNRERIKVAVIGMGPIGNLHAGIYQNEELTNLVATCEIDENKRKFSESKFGINCYSSIQELFKNHSIDLCSITTGGYEYGSDHYEPTIYALKNDSHVLCEKPISNDIVKAFEMVSTAKQHKKIFSINLNHRFTPAARLAKKWQIEGKIGHPLFINMSIWINNPNESSPFFHIKALHPHSIDIIRYYFGDIEQVHCFAMKGPGRNIWSNAQFNLKFTNGTIGSLTGSYDIERGHPMERCEVAGINGRFVIDDMYKEATLYPAGDLNKTVYTNPTFGGMQSFNDTFKNRTKSLIYEIKNNTSPDDIDGSGLDGLKAQIVLEAAVQSIKKEKVIKLKDVFTI